MNTFKSGLLFLMTMLLSKLMMAQGIDEGRKNYYYEKYISAKAIFEKLKAENPNNLDAVYWLGQTYIALDDVDNAKNLYLSTLSANSNSGLILAGVGHVELLQGKTQDARNHFETAISLTQGKNAAVLNAVGFANINSKEGDVAYAVDKLKQATQLKGMKDPDVFANLGDAYKKQADGGNAQLSYEAALNLNANYARASYRIGKIYQTQGIAQEEIYMKYFNDAIAKDAAYPPVYENLYQLFYSTNVTKSAEYLEKYIAAKGPVDEPNSCYLRASMKYAQGLFPEAVSESQKCIAGNPDPYPNNYGLQGYAYNRMGDSAKAKAAFELYFQKQKPSKLGPNDYKTYADILLKFPGNEALAGNYMEKAIEADSTEAGKVALIKSVAQSFESQKKYNDAAGWYNRILSVKKNVSKTDLYNAGYNYFRGGNYNASIGVFNTYSIKFPEDPFGYYMAGKANWAIDSTLSQGLANSFFEKAIITAQADSVKYKNQLVGSLKYFLVYYATAKRDNATALQFADRILVIDPNDTETQNNKITLSAPSKGPKTPTPPKPGAPVTSVNEKGEKTTVNPDGSVTTTAKDGSVITVTKDGKVTTVKDGVTTIIEKNKVTTIGKDGKVTTVAPPEKPAAPKKN